jgi:DNA-directed RNA polymerase specialized sigma24 family protein
MISVANWYSERARNARARKTKTKTNGQTLCGGAMQATVAPIANCLRTLPPLLRASEVIVHLKGLPKRRRDVLQSIIVESNSIKKTAAKLAMSEGAVRVALHRGLAKLAAKLRNE